VTVSLKDNINCASCNAKSACGISGSNSKEIEVFTTNQSFSINEPVNITLQKELGLKAVFWAYFFPFILMLIVLIIGSAFFKEWIVGLLSILILIPYYLMLYISKDSFKKAFKISILKH
ncbi:MAG: SoxR reducing system RseC family protein, partial [Bacteroidota bacterium]